MLKKYVLYARGFMRLSTLIILVILGISVYVWQDKLREITKPWIEASAKDGAIYYANGIWKSAKGIQNISDQKNQRAMELVGNVKTVQDKAGLFSLSVPESWNVSMQQGALGTQISKTVTESSSFLKRTVANDIYYDNGAELSVQVNKGEQASVKLADGGYGKALVQKKVVNIGGESAVYYEIKDSAVKSGVILEAPIIHSGNTYLFQFFFNKEKYSDGEFTFNEILASFKFADKK